MVVGNGLIANTLSSFQSDEQVIVFASGVSNSSEVNKESFDREFSILNSIKNDNKKLVYFSTCSIYDQSANNTPYVQHKINVEKYIESKFSSYLMLRLPTLVGNTKNPHTFFNHFKNSIFKNEKLIVYKNAWRYLLDADDLKQLLPIIIREYFNENKILNVAYNNQLLVSEFVNILAMELKKNPIIDYVSNGTKFDFDKSDFQNLLKKHSIAISDNYNNALINKYATNG